MVVGANSLKLNNYHYYLLWYLLVGEFFYFFPVFLAKMPPKFIFILSGQSYHNHALVLNKRSYLKKFKE